jgi:2-keto-4-pentenoate hydratase/2-oxohepta-3-ene-1,7-dioic acid hydratase in catechol pathway
MHLATFVTGNGVPRAGVLVGDADGRTVVDLQLLDPALPTDVVEILSGSVGDRTAIEAAVANAPTSACRPLSDVELLSPVLRPGKIIAVGLNYRDHAEETGDAIPDYPVVFAKLPSSVTGPHADVVYPAMSARLDYEAELGVVIGRRCRNISENEAGEVIGGYLVLNDISARDVQNRTSQWVLGKSFDTFAPMGPAVVTADSIRDPQDLGIRLHVNGELRQQSNTSNMIFTVRRLISLLSEVCTLEPGDIIATGTPGGVGIGFRPERLLSVGDRVTVEIDGIGSIANRIVAQAPSS